MSDSITIEIPLSKSKLTKLLFFAFIFIAAGIWMFIGEPLSGHWLLGNPTVKNVVAALAVVMGLAGIVFFTKKLRDKRPGFVINEEGIIDNAAAYSYGKIHWRDISHFQLTKMMNQQFIVIGLKNPLEYIDRFTSSSRRKALRWNEKQYGSPVVISPNSLKCNRQELIKMLEDGLASYRASIAGAKVA